MFTQSSNAATANNSLIFNPTIAIGDGNETTNRTDQEQKASSEASSSLGASLGLGIGGGSGSGGPVSMPGQGQAPQGTAPISGGIASMMQNTTVMIMAGVIGIGGILFIVLGRRKKK